MLSDMADETKEPNVVGLDGKAVNPPPVRDRLPAAAKRRIVEMFACFQSVSAIQAAIEDEFGVRMDRRSVMHYDAGKPSARVGSRLKELHAEARKAYIERAADVAIAHQAHRLRMLERLIERADKAKDFGNAIKGLELAAKEMGGALSNVSRVEGKVAHVHLSAADAKAELAARLSQVIDGGLLQHQPTGPDAS